MVSQLSEERLPNNLMVLLIEDNPDDMVLIKQMLVRQTLAKVELFFADRLARGLALLTENRFDVVLLDLSLPDSFGLETFFSIKSSAQETPIIILSGYDDEETALRSVREGAQDYLIKGEITAKWLIHSICYAIERRDVRKKLLASEQQARTIINESLDGIILVDDKGIIKYANPAAIKLFGMGFEKLLGSEFGFPLGKEGVPSEIELLAKGQKFKIVEMRIVKIEFEGESLSMVSLRDITDQKNVQEKLEKNNRELLSLNKTLQSTQMALEKQAMRLKEETRYKSEFLANMSHELRSPLNSIILLAESLAENGDKNLIEEQIKFSRIIHNSGKDLLALINDILDLSKVEAGRMETFVSQVDLRAFAREVEYTYGIQAEKKGLGFEVGVSHDLPEYIITDRQKLEQIIRNFLSNALKFTETGRIEFGIDPSDPVGNIPSGLHRGRGESCIALSVRDSGIGIQEKYMEKVFDEFQQGDGSSSRKYGGTGLGLSISMKLSRLLNGTISVESKPGKGSCFTLYLPRKLEVSEHVMSDRRKEFRKSADQGTSREVVKQLSGKLAGSRILLVDDDMRTLFSMTRVLEKNNLTVIKASSGQMALDTLGEHPPPDLILMDIMMPEMDGYETIRRVRANEKETPIPIIALTAKAMAEDREKCILAGADDYASKPVRLHELFEKMARLIQKESYHANTFQNSDR